MNPLWEYLLGQIITNIRSLESDIAEIKAKIDELLTWAQRLALLAGLWAGAVGINLDPDKVGAALVQLLKSVK